MKKSVCIPQFPQKQKIICFTQLTTPSPQSSLEDVGQHGGDGDEDDEHDQHRMIEQTLYAHTENIYLLGLFIC